MLPWLTEHYGNPSAGNAPGRRARLALDEARDEVARCLGCDPGEVVFCSGGTEAANLAVSGSKSADDDAVSRRSGAPTILCSAIEHHAVLKPVLSAGGGTVRVGSDGVIDLDHLESALGPDVASRRGDARQQRDRHGATRRPRPHDSCAGSLPERHFS